MVGIIYVYVDTVFGFYGYFFFFFCCFFLHCFVGCLSIIVWTPAVLGVLNACFVFLYLHLFSAVGHFSHGKAL